MPCWYYEKKDLQNTPSYRDGVSQETEARYRKEGARFIIDAGTKMGLRYDTCATGVVYFHRFYMFHSFKEFPRYVTASCCLFLAGKVEETPKKCKDLIKTTRSMLSDVHFATFKEDPKEEVMTLERILLQTIKFDLMVEHPYAFLLKFAKLIKGDKARVEKLVQMSWTFINDSLCTTLSLQWEPEVIAVALMYLTSRLNKHEISDWHGRPLGYRSKWYEFFVEDVTLDLLEDICHQVLDLYSKPSQKGNESPSGANIKKSSSEHSVSTPKTPKSPEHPKKIVSQATQPITYSGNENTLQKIEVSSTTAASASSTFMVNAASDVVPQQGYGQPANPYVSAQMFSSSFMSSEGARSIQSLMVGEKLENQYPTSSQRPVSQPKVIYQTLTQPVGASTSRPVHATSSNISYCQQPQTILQAPGLQAYTTVQQPIYLQQSYKEQPVAESSTYEYSAASYLPSTYASQPHLLQQTYVNQPTQQNPPASQQLTYITQQPNSYVSYQQPPGATYQNYASVPTPAVPVRLIQLQQGQAYQQYDNNSHAPPRQQNHNWY